ncbi:MAG TPA: DUF3297 family protein [Dokdonella sp.]|uniref:DUF3297 family protein n=1 Tax=Dokdonella sp. TaxID=2291710 RepID=UPI002B57B107|nr:DUF3297 family protein [Dokdonella sp.]HUD43615.1 DUF3297 family protein [Dokdonella sp.]
MTEPFPDRLSVDPRSPFHDAALLERPIGIRFNGRERHDVEEYCISEGWIRVAAGRALDRRGRPMTVKLKGAVEPFFVGPDAETAPAD